MFKQLALTSVLSLLAVSAFAADNAPAAVNPNPAANPAANVMANPNVMTLAAATTSAEPASAPTAPAYTSPGPDISGSYTCTGYDPFGKTNFNSTVTVTKNGDTYSFQWLSNGYPYNLGTGIYHKDVKDTISVVFWNPKKPDYFGTEVFMVKPDGSLTANWTVQAESQVGTENCTKNKS